MQKLRPKYVVYLKMRIFWRKTVKIALASGASPPNLRVVTPVYFYNFVSSNNCVLFPLKKKTKQLQ